MEHKEDFFLDWRQHGGW